MNVMLLKFKMHCERWHRTRNGHDYRGRTYVVAHLTSLYGIDAVIRHKKSIIRTLNNAEGIHITDV